jgi:hypothetical protein
METSLRPRDTADVQPTPHEVEADKEDHVDAEEEPGVV